MGLFNTVNQYRNMLGTTAGSGGGDEGGSSELSAPAPYGGIGQELLNVPFPEMVKSMAMGIAEAQIELDMASARAAQIMAGMPASPDGQGLTMDFNGENLCLLELGFTPTFYQFTETEISVKMTLSFTSETIQKTKTFKLDMGAGFSQNATWQQWFLGAETASARANISTVNSSTSNKYSMEAEGVSSMKTKLVPLPPPAILEERLRQVVELRRAQKEAAATAGQASNSASTTE